MRTTENLGLKKPEKNEFYDVDVVNYNTDALDALFEKDENGEVAAKNAKTLDGHGAEYFAKISDFANRQLEKNVFSTESEIDTFYDTLHTNALDCSVYEGWISHNVSHSVLGGGHFYVWGAKTNRLYGWQKATSYADGVTLAQYERSMFNGVWGKWTKEFTTAGGTINGDVIIGKESDEVARNFVLRNKNRSILIQALANGDFRIYDNTRGAQVLKLGLDGTNTFNGTASGNLPLTGGTVENANRRVMSVSNNSGTAASIGYRNGDTLLGEIGVKSTGAFFNESNGTSHTILHTGNKPTGTYTGNGDTAQRTINTGGVGEWIAITNDSNSSEVFVSIKGGFGKRNNGADSTVGLVNSCAFSNGYLQFWTDDYALNASGVTYKWQVL